MSSHKIKAVCSTTCQVCGHNMGRSICHLIGPLKYTVRCNKCKAIHDVTIKIPEAQPLSASPFGDEIVTDDDEGYPD